MVRAERAKFRKNDPAGMRKRVIDAAACAFQAQGYGATSMHDVVRAAAVTGGALYHHFPTKKDLALAVVAERVSGEIADTWIAAVDGAPSGAEGIVGVFEETADALDRQGSVSGCPLGNLALELSLADDGLRRAVEDEYRAWQDAIAARLDRDERAGRADFVAGDAAGLAGTVVAMFTGAMSIAKARQDATALRACARRLRRMMGLPAGSGDQG
ncbi:TetR/AcrR family transcriptional regulator [Sphingomonas sp. So64.6b]|uniref:TetR/AcrR family transcriptional regulator n=1 Tax=Sphingomonas sp. So64.6b TaxID=2997354 RepID=UPI001602BE05|nr:TetR/AcrR family transcriptional regulator [Sphingomonas sp. So64.6b]QNA82793.1 TetR/AcrR family transcriptional regulator [Sphingomonas sp. So64.6b]